MTNQTSVTQTQVTSRFQAMELFSHAQTREGTNARNVVRQLRPAEWTVSVASWRPTKLTSGVKESFFPKADR